MTTHVTIIDIVLFVVIGLLLIVLAERSAKAKKLYAKLTKEFESQQETLGMAIDSLHKVKSDRQKLFDIAKGATAKLAEMNVALEGLEVKEGWIEDVTTINFKENEGRTFEVKMKSPSGEIHTGRVSVWGDYNQAVRIDDGSFGTWRWDLNSDGTLKQDSIRPFTFRWID